MTAYEHLKRDMIEAAEQGIIEIFGQFGMWRTFLLQIEHSFQWFSPYEELEYVDR